MSPATVYALESRRPPPPHWPIERPCLAALKDLGLSDEKIACYFRVGLADVALLRTTYGIAEQVEPVRGEPRSRRLFAWRRRA
jgi:hypothetical protein